MWKLIVVYLISLLFLTACSPNAHYDNVMQDYLKRVSRVTDIEYKPFDNALFPAIPPLSSRQFNISDTTMKAFTALDLLLCPRLSQKVAYRNSSLGRQMMPSQRLHYEKELLIELEACIDYLQTREEPPEILEELQTIESRKRAQLPMVLWNAMFGNVEFIDQLHQTRYPLTDEGQGREGTLNSLHYLSRYFPDPDAQPPYSREELERHLQQFNASDYSGRLVYSVVRLTYTLNEIAFLLETSLNEKAICPDGKLNQTGERLMNVFKLIYIGKLQPYLSQISRQQDEWQQAVLMVLSQLPEPPTAEMSVYLDQLAARNGISANLQSAVLRHVKNWTVVFDRCGVSVRSMQ